jgi:hypothetical protein
MRVNAPVRDHVRALIPAEALTVVGLRQREIPHGQPATRPYALIAILPSSPSGGVTRINE